MTDKGSEAKTHVSGDKCKGKTMSECFGNVDARSQCSPPPPPSPPSPPIFVLIFRFSYLFPPLTRTLASLPPLFLPLPPLSLPLSLLTPLSFSGAEAEEFYNPKVLSGAEKAAAAGFQEKAEVAAVPTSTCKNKKCNYAPSDNADMAGFCCGYAQIKLELMRNHNRAHTHTHTRTHTHTHTDMDTIVGSATRLHLRG
jgi:hypothetical protein